MARTPAQRGETGNWLVESRMARGWTTQKQARAEIERLTRWRIPQSVYAEWESGRRMPSDANLEKLRGFYGTPAASGATGGRDDTSAIIAAIDRLTAAVGEQTRQQLSGMAGLGDALGMVLARLGGLPERTPDGQADPHQAVTR